MKCPRARTRGLVVQDPTDGATAIVIDPGAHRAHALGAASAVVFRLCDGKRAIAEIAAEMHEALGLPADETIVWAALDGLSRAGLLKEPLPRSTSGRSGARRALVKQLAASGVIALTTLAYVPSAAAAHRHKAYAGESVREAKAHAKLPSGPFGGPSATDPIACT